jgi:hypothetical protein
MAIATGEDKKYRRLVDSEFLMTRHLECRAVFLCVILTYTCLSYMFINYHMECFFVGNKYLKNLYYSLRTQCRRSHYLGCASASVRRHQRPRTPPPSPPPRATVPPRPPPPCTHCRSRHGSAHAPQVAAPSPSSPTPNFVLAVLSSVRHTSVRVISAWSSPATTTSTFHGRARSTPTPTWTFHGRPQSKPTPTRLSMEGTRAVHSSSTPTRPPHGSTLLDAAIQADHDPAHHGRYARSTRGRWLLSSFDAPLLLVMFLSTQYF